MSDLNVREITEQKDKYELAVFECIHCGFHLGLDASYLEQVSQITMPCPSCHVQLVIDGSE